MTKCHIVVEGQADAALLSTVLKAKVSEDVYAFFVAGGRSSAVSVARSILVSRPTSVALVLDADTTETERIEEQRVELDELLGLVGHRDRYGIFLAVPSAEACLFQDREGLQRIFGNKLSTELIIRSEFQPKHVLEQLFQQDGKPYTPSNLQELVSQLDLDRLASAPFMHGLIEFVHKAAEATVS